MKRMKLTEREMLRYVLTAVLKYDKMESTNHIIGDFAIYCTNLTSLVCNPAGKPFVMTISDCGLFAGYGSDVMEQIVEFNDYNHILKIIMIVKVKGSDKEYDVVEFKRI